jgi:hypothetical protein
VSVGMYYRLSEFVNCFHSRSCCIGAKFVVPCCLPIRALSLLKSPSKMILLSGLLWTWLNIVVWIMGIRKYVESRWFVSLIICRYGEMLAVVGILVIFPGNVCF